MVPSGRQLVGRFLKDVALVMDLHVFAPVGGRLANWRDWRRCERFTEVGENRPDRPRLGDERDEPDVAAASRGLPTFPMAIAVSRRRA